MDTSNTASSPAARKPYGMLALFDSAPGIYEAARTVREAGYSRWDALTPFPVHGLDGAMGLGRSKVPVFVFIGGVIGFFVGMWLAWWMGYYNYPLIVGGKPYFSPIFPFPVAYELTILLAAFGALGGMFVCNRLPMHNHPVFNYEKFRHLTDDMFAVVIEAEDPLYDAEGTRTFLEELGPVEVTALYDDEEDDA
ncbi:MAG: DUF3341 domain-containing protein [Opitutales bacterium]|nr:DUF3341 domain-containing protein [Opitutales bacterium]